MSDASISGGLTISMYRGTRRTTAGTKSVTSSITLTSGAYLGLSTPSTKPPVTATTICVSHEPNASTTVFQK